MTEQPYLRQFLLYAFALLIPCFTLWTVFGHELVMPAVGLVHLILTGWFPDVVHALYLDGGNALLMTEFGEQAGRLVPLAGAEYRLGFQVNPRILSYSLPFYTALHFAMRRDHYVASYLWGVLTLYCLIVIGLLCLCLKTLMVQLGGTFLDQPGVLVPHANVIGILYQFSVLITPTLAPIILLLAQNRDTLLADMPRVAG